MAVDKGSARSGWPLFTVSEVTVGLPCHCQLTYRLLTCSSIPPKGLHHMSMASASRALDIWALLQSNARFSVNWLLMCLLQLSTLVSTGQAGICAPLEASVKLVYASHLEPGIHKACVHIMANADVWILCL